MIDYTCPCCGLQGQITEEIWHRVVTEYAPFRCQSDDCRRWLGSADWEIDW